MRVLTYFAPRLVAALVTMLGVSALVFLALRFIPGGYADIFLGLSLRRPRARRSPCATDSISPCSPSSRIGLSRSSTAISASRWCQRAPVADEFLRRAPVTLELALLALGFALAVGVPLGVISGTTASGGSKSMLGRLVGALGASVPDFVLGSLLIFVFSVWPLWLRVGGYTPFVEDPVGNLRTMLLPAVTLSLFGVALVLRTTRDAVLRVMTEGYITAAVARGERPFDIIRLHVMRNAAIPVVTVVTTYFGFLLGGAVVVEVLSSIPGIGFYTFSGLEEPRLRHRAGRRPHCGRALHRDQHAVRCRLRPDRPAHRQRARLMTYVATMSRHVSALWRKDRLSLLGVGLLIFLILIGLVGPYLPLGDPMKIAAGQRLSGPNWQFPFGTDELGRSFLPRVVEGVRRRPFSFRPSPSS